MGRQSRGRREPVLERQHQPLADRQNRRSEETHSRRNDEPETAPAPGQDNAERADREQQNQEIARLSYQPEEFADDEDHGGGRPKSVLILRSSFQVRAARRLSGDPVPTS